MRLALFADGNVGKAICRWLLDNWPNDIAVIVTTSGNEIIRMAQQSGVPSHVFVSTSQFQRFCNDNRIELDLGLLAWWPKIVDSDLLAMPERGFLNTHPSLLPYNRGKHYNFWAIIEEAPFGVTLHQVDNGIDTGNIVGQQAIDYGWLDTGQSLYEKATSAMIELVCQTYPSLRGLDFESHPQATGIGSFHRAKEIEAASQIHLDQAYTGRQLINMLRARTFPPHPGCWFNDGDGQYEIRVTIGKKN